jgi:hypothetical protein
MTVTTIDTVLDRWNSGEGRPYKGSLIDWSSYTGDGEAPPANIGCMCAQGQVLHLLGGWSPRRLKDTAQADADLATAKLLNISRGHAVLLRGVNDSVDGAPSIVLTDPEKVLGDQANKILDFWVYLDSMTAEQWDAAWAAARAAARDAARAAAWAAARDAARAAARDAAWAAAWAAARDAARAAARDAAWAAAWAAARDAAWAAAWAAARDAARDAARAAARDAAWAAEGATSEIMGARILRENGTPFFFLPVFGFASPEEIPARPADYGQIARSKQFPPAQSANRPPTT